MISITSCVFLRKNKIIKPKIKIKMRILKEEKVHINLSSCVNFISETMIQWIMMIIWGKSSGCETI